MTPLETLSDIGNRFLGVSLDFRRAGTDWPAPWRARLVAAKNERADYRVEAFGESAESAIAGLWSKVI
jgi:hypothetical protein